MRKLLILSALALAACASQPAPGASLDDATNGCQEWAYQQTPLVWLGAIGVMMAKDTQEYRGCMAKAGYPVSGQ